MENTKKKNTTSPLFQEGPRQKWNILQSKEKEVILMGKQMEKKQRETNTEKAVISFSVLLTLEGENRLI